MPPIRLRPDGAVAIRVARKPAADMLPADIPAVTPARVKRVAVTRAVATRVVDIRPAAVTQAGATPAAVIRRAVTRVAVEDTRAAAAIPAGAGTAMARVRRTDRSPTRWMFRR